MKLGKQIDFPAFNLIDNRAEDNINNVNPEIYKKIRDLVDDPVFDLIFSEIEVHIINAYAIR